MLTEEAANQFIETSPHNKRVVCRHCKRLVCWARRGGNWRVIEIDTGEFHHCPRKGAQ